MKQQLVVGDRDRPVHATQGILDDQAILTAAEDEAKAGIVALGAELIVHDRQVEVYLAAELGFERNHLQVDDNVAVKPCMVEKQVEVEILTTEFQVVLVVDERKTFAKGEEKLFDLFGQRRFKVTFMSIGSEI